MGEWVRRELESLGFHWGSAYDISYHDGVYKAERRGEPQHTLCALTAAGLRDLIRTDYGAWHRPRHLQLVQSGDS